MKQKSKQILSDKNEIQLYYGKQNFVKLFIALCVLICGWIIMSVDKSEYGFGFFGLTLGPILVLCGLILPIFSLFKKSKSNASGKKRNLSIKSYLKDHHHAVMGWLIFSFSCIVYFLTVEPTVSFWDCGEFIAASYKLEVPHPPGAPLFLLLGRFFSLFAPDKESIALCVNMVSVISSAFTVAFLYWSMILLIKKFEIKTGKSFSSVTKVVVSAGSALTFAFTDSFWFNAEEAEVYALSCFFTAISFWAILKWDENYETENANGWIILIFYLIGLSIGVHLLNLLTLPAFALVVYLKKYKPSVKGIFVTLVISSMILLLLMDGIITGLPSLAGTFEILLINTFHFPFGSGLWIFIFLFTAVLIFLYRYALRKRKQLLQLSLLCSVYVIIGYSSYMVIGIRSGFNPPIDENNPENILNMVSYLKREQYGSRPLIKGPYFTAGYPESVIKSTPRYKANKETGAYEIYDHDNELIYNKDHVGFFPRAYSTDPAHVESYKKWMNSSGDEKPTMIQNLGFLFRYQIWHMYFRYFLWNFAGRNSDEQNAAWISPNDWPEERSLPSELSSNKAHNNYYCIPLLIGIIGMFYHFRKDKKSSGIVLTLFFFTGIAIVLYLNQPPIEPRERDYTYVGSFYAFSLWIGFGFLAVIDFAGRWLKRDGHKNILIASISIMIPMQMFYVNLDDHNRAERYFALDSAKNLLGGCAPNAILFCAADNDTFPLWYVQEVEGFRTDVRICNLSLLQSDWYIDAMKKKSNESEPLPVSMEEKDFIRGQNEQIIVSDNREFPNGIDLKNYFEMLEKNDERVYYSRPDADRFTLLPAKTLILKVDSNAIIQSGLIPANLKNNVIQEMKFNFSGSIFKSELTVLDIITHNNWKRPIYFDNSAIRDFEYLRPYLQNEGNAFRLFPVSIPGAKEGWINTELAYKNLIENSVWRSTKNPYVPQDKAGIPFIYGARIEHLNLVAQLVREGKTHKAIDVIAHSLESIPDECYSFDYVMVPYADLLFDLKKENVAAIICDRVGKKSIEQLNYLRGINSDNENNARIYLYALAQLSDVLKKHGKISEAKRYDKFLNSF
jgi:hypothetical protein